MLENLIIKIKMFDMRTEILLLSAVLVFFVSCNDDSSSNPAAVACFDYSPKVDLKVGDEITFTNCSDNIRSVAWDFNDGNISYEENPKHTFGLAGVYAVMQIVANETSTDNVTENIYISGGPNGFTYKDTLYLLENFIICDDLGEGNSTIALSTSGVTFNCSTLEWSAGTGDLVVFRITDENIKEGTYTMIAGSDEDKIWGEFAIGWTPSSESGKKRGEFTSGTLLVKLVNDKYELIFNFESSIGKVLGHFLEE